MGFIEGKERSAFIRPGKPQPIKQMVAVIRKLAIALDEAHQTGVVHRDLKPDNVMIDKRGTPIIMDFGLAIREASGDARWMRLVTCTTPSHPNGKSSKNESTHRLTLIANSSGA
jgi:serine/threonine protein kinase